MEIDEKAFVAAIRKRAADNPDHKYMPTNGYTCVYAEVNPETGKLEGSCLIGCGLVDAGIPAETLQTTAAFSTGWLHERGIYGLSHLVVNWARTAQRAQDMRRTWGAAVKEADGRYPLRESLR